MRIVVTGATGLIGNALVPALIARGARVIALSRDAERARTQLGIPVESANLEDRGSWTASLVGADAVIHLAGEPVGSGRWDAHRKQAIRDSRVESTRTIVEAIEALPAAQRPKALITASGIDYYPFAVDGPLDDDEVTERDPPSDEFLGRVCRDWEREARAAERLGVRVARVRIGFVLCGGGALAKLTTPFRWFVGGRVGNGRQWLSWIHLDDVVGIFAAAAHDARYVGPINAVADSLRNREFARALGKALGRPSWLPVPKRALELAVGELAAYLVHGRRVVPARLRELGYAWKYRELDDALAVALRR